MKKLFSLFLIFSLIETAIPQTENQAIDSSIFRKAEQLCKDFIIADTHIDLPDWLYDGWFDVTQPSD